MAEHASDGLSAPLPWQRPLWARLQETLKAGRLPHALLLCGPAGMGKTRFAGLLARSLLCRHPDAGGLPCGACTACVLVRAGTHPDLRLCEPAVDARTEKEKESIGIDQVRELTAFMALKAHHDGYKIAIIRPADRLNPSSANALLKTLEEPPRGGLLVLVSARPARLPATVRSRCQRLRFAPAWGGEAAGWLSSRLPAGSDPELLLALAGGAPLSALEIAGEGGLERREAMLEELDALAAGRADPLRVAEAWLKFGVKESLYWLYAWLADMIRLQAAEAPPCLANPGQKARLQRLSRGAEAERLHRELARVAAGLRLAEGQANPQLLLEDVLISWSRIAENRLPAGS